MEIELLGESGNCALAARASRQFPGLLIQGDTLNSLREVADGLVSELESGAVEDSRYSAIEIKEALDEFIATYERLMREAGRSLPY
ncbi:hypothetical protein OG741_15980 [Streptomyces sp. NBC_01410]|uniref:DUF6959 family protein n=1 Tax=Streptomyces sp. NBC_01410 TaxID=2903856 RepID=UPI0032544C97